MERVPRNEFKKLEKIGTVKITNSKEKQPPKHKRLSYDEMDLVATTIIKGGLINYTENGKMIHDKWTDIAKHVRQLCLVPSVDITVAHIKSAIGYFEASSRHRKVELPLPPADHKELAALKEQVSRLLKDQEQKNKTLAAIHDMIVKH